jgi:hypothetical protein
MIDTHGLSSQTSFVRLCRLRGRILNTRSSGKLPGRRGDDSARNLPEPAATGLGGNLAGRALHQGSRCSFGGLVPRGEIRDVVVDLKRYHLAAWQNEVWRVAWGPDELVPMFHATQANTQYCRGVLKNVRVAFLVQLRDGDNGSSTDVNSTVGSMKHDWVRRPRTA